MKVFVLLIIYLTLKMTIRYKSTLSVRQKQPCFNHLSAATNQDIPYVVDSNHIQKLAKSTVIRKKIAYFACKCRAYALFACAFHLNIRITNLEIVTEYGVLSKTDCRIYSWSCCGR